MKNHTSFDYEYAYSYCRKIVLSHYENFPVGSLLVPKKSRKHFYAIYAFARKSDDIADSGSLTPDEKLNDLNELENQLGFIESGDLKELEKQSAQIFIALHNTINELNINTEEFRNLLKAFKQDSVKNRYSEFEELIEYSDNSANPVGHLVLNIFGYRKEKDEKVFRFADCICTALQLTNFWQDAGEDLKIDRVYIPETEMRKSGYSYDMLFQKAENENFRKMMKQLITKTRELFEEGREILNYTAGRLRLELKATIAGGEEILNLIEDINFNVLNERVKISRLRKIKLILNVLVN